VSDEDSTFEDVRFDPNRDRDVGFFSDNCSPESEEEKFMCDYPLPRGSFWSGSLTTNTTNPSIDVWVMVSSNSFSSSLWYMDGKISRIRIGWRDDDLIRISDQESLEIVGLYDEDFPSDLMGITRKRGEKMVGEFYLKKRDLSKNVFVSLGGSWMPAHVLEEIDESIECVVLFSKQAVSSDVLSLTLTVREDRVRRGKTVDHCVLTAVDSVLLTILEFAVERGEELQMLSYLSTRVRSLTTSPKCNEFWKSLSLARWSLLKDDMHNENWRMFYLSRQQFDYPTTKTSQRDYVVDVYCDCSDFCPQIDMLNSGKLRFQFRCPFKWDDMKPIKMQNGASDKMVRKCRNCKRKVSYTVDIQEARDLISQGEAVSMPLIPDGVDYGPKHNLSFFPEIPAKHKIQIQSALPKHLQELRIEGLRHTFENMESRKSYADLVTFLDYGPRRLDVMDVTGFKVSNPSDSIIS